MSELTENRERLIKQGLEKDLPNPKIKVSTSPKGRHEVVAEYFNDAGDIVDPLYNQTIKA